MMGRNIFSFFLVVVVVTAVLVGVWIGGFDYMRMRQVYFFAIVQTFLVVTFVLLIENRVVGLGVFNSCVVHICIGHVSSVMTELIWQVGDIDAFMGFLGSAREIGLGSLVVFLILPGVTLGWMQAVIIGGVLRWLRRCE